MNGLQSGAEQLALELLLLADDSLGAQPEPPA
jgi:hypothetical protein